MKSTEVWRFSTDGSEQWFAHVMIDVGRLAVPEQEPMAFVSNCVLVRILRENPTVQTGLPNVLVDGMFLVPKRRSLQAAGFVRVGSHPVAIESIEFPCWLIEDSKRGLLFCRGETAQQVRAQQPKDVYKRWNVRLTPYYPEQLIDSIKRHCANTAGVTPPTFGSIASSDIRYHSDRRRILSDCDVELSQAYLSALQEYNWRRIPAYRDALA